MTIALGLVVAPRADGENWPEFRGPTGQGLVSGGPLAITWSQTKNVVWKQPIPGKGWSSPIVVEGRVYLTTSVPTGDGAMGDQSLRVLCLDAATGKLLWDREVFHQQGARSPGIHGKNSHASPTPLIHEDRLYVHFGHQGTACLDLAGKILWTATSYRYAPVHGNGGSPIVVNDLLVFNCDGGDQRCVVALDRHSGKEVWKADRPGNPAKKFSFSTPLVIGANGKKQIVSPGSDVVSAYDPATGSEIWRVRYDGYSVVPRPVFGHGLVFVCTGFNTPSLLAIRPDGSGDVTDTHVAWQTRKSVPHTPSVLLVGDDLFMVSDKGLASCLDARTGKVYWQERLPGDFSASPIHADGRIYFESEQGTGIVVRAARKFEQLARNTVDERMLASPAAADGALFMRTEKFLYRVQAR
jgi:outer membrane protein assembly factor BamB